MKIEKHDLNCLYQYCYSLTNRQEDAYDLLQSGIEKWLRSSTQEIHLGYIRKIIRNLYIDICRRKKLVAFEKFEENTPLLFSETSIEQINIDMESVEHLMSVLSDAERETLYLWAVLEYSAAEISIEIDEPRGTVLSRLYRIKKKLAASQHAHCQDIGSG